jgi:hypothetical protein
MNDMNNVNKVRTTIGVRLATKYLILENSKPGESLEDTIVRIIKTNELLLNENENLREILLKNDIMTNQLVLTNLERGRNAITYENTSYQFSYNIPDDELANINEYTMEISIEKIIENGKAIDMEEVELEDILKVHFKIIEKIINLHFDSSFQVHGKIFIFDPRYWKKIFNRVGLPDSSYIKDLIPLIDEYERG